jgi:exopolysaccharide biosynthesis polyprenyl glycosylphosphotransferase
MSIAHVEHRAARPRPPALRRRHLVAANRGLLLLLVAVLVAFAGSQSGVGALATAAVLALIWNVTLTSAYRAARLSVLALGVPVCALLGTASGLAAVSLAGFWFPLLRLTPAQVVLAAVGVFAVSAGAERSSQRYAARQRLLVVGASAAVEELLRELEAQPGLPFECLGVIADAGAGGPGGPWLGTTDELAEVVRRERPDLVVVDELPDRGLALERLLDGGSLELRVVGIADFYEYAFGRVPVQHLSPLWFMSVLHLYQRRYSRLAKRVLDLAGAATLLVLSAPLLLAVALLVRCSGPGPVFYRQLRCGEGGRLFTIVKFRTMVADAEAAAASYAAVDDPRVTPLGRLLRRVRLDELPQLWNVVRGEMSIVGPRPERPEFMGLLEGEVPFWSRRLLVKPGITGWAQVRHGYASDPGSAADKLAYDLYYLKHRSLQLDLAITLMTARVLISGSGAR